LANVTLVAGELHARFFDKHSMAWIIAVAMCVALSGHGEARSSVNTSDSAYMCFRRCSIEIPSMTADFFFFSFLRRAGGEIIFLNGPTTHQQTFS
jgi:hypothetical protein